MITIKTVNEQSYTLVEKDLGLRVKLDAYLAKADGSQKSETASVEYQPITFDGYQTFKGQEEAVFVLRQDGTLLYEVLEKDPAVVLEEGVKAFDSALLKEKFSAIYAGDNSILAVKADGSVVTWGKDLGIPADVIPKLQDNIQEVIIKEYAVAVLTKDKHVISWYRRFSR